MIVEFVPVMSLLLTPVFLFVTGSAVRADSVGARWCFVYEQLEPRDAGAYVPSRGLLATGRPGMPWRDAGYAPRIGHVKNLLPIVARNSSSILAGCDRPLRYCPCALDNFPTTLDLSRRASHWGR